MVQNGGTAMYHQMSTKGGAVVCLTQGGYWNTLP